MDGCYIAYIVVEHHQIIIYVLGEYSATFAPVERYVNIEFCKI